MKPLPADIVGKVSRIGDQVGWDPHALNVEVERLSGSAHPGQRSSDPGKDHRQRRRLRLEHLGRQGRVHGRRIRQRRIGRRVHREEVIGAEVRGDARAPPVRRGARGDPRQRRGGESIRQPTEAGGDAVVRADRLPRDDVCAAAQRQHHRRAEDRDRRADQKHDKHRPQAALPPGPAHGEDGRQVAAPCAQARQRSDRERNQPPRQERRRDPAKSRRRSEQRVRRWERARISRAAALAEQGDRGDRQDDDDHLGGDRAAAEQGAARLCSERQVVPARPVTRPGNQRRRDLEHAHQDHCGPENGASGEKARLRWAAPDQDDREAGPDQRGRAAGQQALREGRAQHLDRRRPAHPPRGDHRAAAPGDEDRDEAEGGERHRGGACCAGCHHHQREQPARSEVVEQAGKRGGQPGRSGRRHGAQCLREDALRALERGGQTRQPAGVDPLRVHEEAPLVAQGDSRGCGELHQGPVRVGGHQGAPVVDRVGRTVDPGAGPQEAVLRVPGGIRRVRRPEDAHDLGGTALGPGTSRTDQSVRPVQGEREEIAEADLERGGGLLRDRDLEDRDRAAGGRGARAGGRFLAGQGVRRPGGRSPGREGDLVFGSLLEAHRQRPRLGEGRRDQPAWRVHDIRAARDQCLHRGRELPPERVAVELDPVEAGAGSRFDARDLGDLQVGAHRRRGPDLVSHRLAGERVDEARRCGEHECRDQDEEGNAERIEMRFAQATEQGTDPAHRFSQPRFAARPARPLGARGGRPRSTPG